ncbi:MAG: PIN domain-containing protein [Nitrospirae bacterium]|nr:PIN domain-containing protein [Nitrospirota bacterium]
MVIVDTGPLVALFDDSEEQHEVCYAAMKALQAPPVTTWPVLTEAFYMLGGWRKGQSELWDFILSGGVRIEDIPEERYSRIRELMEKYADKPMDFADASVVVISEMHKAKTIFTLDRHDFTIYRPKHTPHFQIIP